MDRKRTAPGGKGAPDGTGSVRRGKRARFGATDIAPDPLSARAMAGARDAFLALVRVNYPHFANIGLTEARMLKIARAEGCRFEEAAFLGAVRQFRRAGGI